MSEFASRIFDQQFEGKNVVIMGGGRGIGLWTASAFAAAGARVVVTDIDAGVFGRVAELAERGLEIAANVCDVTDDKDVSTFFRELGSRWGSLDVLVNNAGIIEINELENTSTESFRRVVDVNTVAQFLAAREALSMLELGTNPSIINAASGQARQGFIYTPSYAASKFGVVGLTQSLAKELADRQIRVNAYCPGIVPTEMWSYNDREWGKRLGNYEEGELMQQWISEIPMGRGATATDVANGILFLASEAASYITGQAINIDGGMFMN